MLQPGGADALRHRRVGGFVPPVESEDLLNQYRSSAGAVVWNAQRARAVEGFLLDEIGLDGPLAFRNDPNLGRGHNPDLALAVGTVSGNHGYDDSAGIVRSMISVSSAGIIALARRDAIGEALVHGPDLNPGWVVTHWFIASGPP